MPAGFYNVLEWARPGVRDAVRVDHFRIRVERANAARCVRHGVVAIRAILRRRACAAAPRHTISRRVRAAASAWGTTDPRADRSVLPSHSDALLRPRQPVTTIDHLAYHQP